MSRIAVIVDNPTRDLSGAVLLGRELALRGEEVFLCSMNLRHREIPALAPDHLVVNYLRPTNDAFIERLMDAGVRITVLDTEGAVFQEPELLAAKMSRRAEVRDRVDAYCAWGQFMADFLHENGYYGPAQMTVTGAPRMDFYSAPWRKAAEIASPARDLPDGPMVLICGSFPFANPKFMTPEDQFEARLAATGLDRELLWAEFEKDQAGLDGFIEMSCALAARRPEIRFVYRPHPFERIATYDAHFDDFPNLTVESAGLVDGWILRASMVIQPADCTTGVEAAMAGVAAVIPDWIPSSRVPVVESVTEPCADIDETVAALDRAVSGIDAAGARPTELMHALFGPLDGRAHVRAADTVTSVPPAGPLDESALRVLHYHPQEGSADRKPVDRLRELLRIPAQWSFRTRTQSPPAKWERGDKFFDEAAVRSILDALDQTEPDARGTVRAALAAASDHRFRFSVGRSIKLTAG